ncbi:alpha/beta-hydrolase [Coniochaeta ligniaria NRRL 30616]|uniref:Alpha/beta-hydrolase n=1 Tax=Coniochaeta ligniaria NRRL 30616 TaxID=1408157 RepID=A0A1J7IZ71_9PEZI|nr:alpha/beta-hydrolase [Coniochaeta ligniaria NRRL 30616]
MEAPRHRQNLIEMAGPGMLYVTMQPQPGLSLDQFHEWYNNEHGPTRLRLPQIFTNGLRYKATDGVEPTFLAVYDITSMSHLETPTYTSLRENRSPREAQTIGQVDVKRSFLDLVSTKASDSFVPIEQLTDEEAEGTVLVAVELTLKDVAGAEEEVTKWNQEEHIPMLSKVPGWLRTRLFQTSSLEGGKRKLVSLHEYAKTNGLGGPEHKASMSTAWREEVFSKCIDQKARRTYSLFYVFGPGPRDLSSLSRLPDSAAFTSADGINSTTPGSSPVITSAIATGDGLTIPYRLEGNPSPSAPTIAFCNSLLTSLHMWDPFVALLKAHRPQFRILRYDFRGRHGIPSPPVPSTLNILSDDISTLLSALRIQRLHALIGVSMGGATTLKFALKFPEKLDRFVTCDFNVASSEANTKAWKERIAVAESTSADGSPGIQTLARQTVERWFHPHTMTEKKDTAEWITQMVASNDVEGFRYGCPALWDYNMKEELKSCKVPGLLVVGDGDGKGALVKAMDGFKDKVGSQGTELKIVPLAGHLPMCESPRDFFDAVQEFL